MNEAALEDRLHLRKQPMMDDAVVEVGREHFARLGSVADEAYRSARFVSVGLQLGLQIEKLGFGVDLETGSIEDRALGAPALALGVPQRLEAVQGFGGATASPASCPGLTGPGPSFMSRYEQHGRSSQTS